MKEKHKIKITILFLVHFLIKLSDRCFSQTRLKGFWSFSFNLIDSDKQAIKDKFTTFLSVESLLKPERCHTSRVPGLN
jgi:hypothetical protein